MDQQKGGKMCTENQHKRRELVILVTVISENYIFQFGKSHHLKVDEQSVMSLKNAGGCWQWPGLKRFGNN